MGSDEIPPGDQLASQLRSPHQLLGGLQLHPACGASCWVRCVLRWGLLPALQVHIESLELILQAALHESKVRLWLGTVDPGTQ